MNTPEPVGETQDLDRIRQRVYPRWPTLTRQQQELMNKHLGLVGLHLKMRVPTPRFPTRDREYEDLFQEGCIALARAAARHRPGQDGPFAAFALPRIRGAIFAALHERFSLVRVPMRLASRPGGLPEGPSFPERHGLDPHTKLSEPETRPEAPLASGETIRHRIRSRFERAVHKALTRLSSRRWSRRNPLPIMKRIASERLLITSERCRTPLRLIGRDFGISSGRVSSYERQLADAVNECFSEDPQIPLLVGFAGDDAMGYDACLDEDQIDALTQADLDAFRRRFDALSRTDQAQVVLSMIERCGSVHEVASNLYRLVRADGADTLCSVA